MQPLRELIAYLKSSIFYNSERVQQMRCFVVIYVSAHWSIFHKALFLSHYESASANLYYLCLLQTLNINHIIYVVYCGAFSPGTTVDIAHPGDHLFRKNTKPNNFSQIVQLTLTSGDVFNNDAQLSNGHTCQYRCVCLTMSV